MVFAKTKQISTQIRCDLHEKVWLYLIQTLGLIWFDSPWNLHANFNAPELKSPEINWYYIVITIFRHENYSWFQVTVLHAMLCYAMLCYAKPRIYYPFEYIWNKVNEVNVWENRTIKEWNTIIELQVKWTWMNHRESKRVKLVLSW